MKATKKLGAILLAMVMTLGLFAALPPTQASAVTYDGVDSEAKLQAALFGGGDTVINITGSFEIKNLSLSVVGKNVTINLNGFTIDISRADNAIAVQNGGLLTVNGPGTLNIVGGGNVNIVDSTFTAAGGAVINITYTGEYAAVSVAKGNLTTTGGAALNIMSYGRVGVNVIGGVLDVTGSIIHKGGWLDQAGMKMGNALDVGNGNSGGTVTFNGDIISDYSGVYTYVDTVVTINGNVSGGNAADRGSLRDTIAYDKHRYPAVLCAQSATVTVNGNVSNSNGTGASVWGGNLTINGNVSGTDASVCTGVQVQGTELKAYITGNITGVIGFDLGDYTLSAPTSKNVQIGGYYWDEYKHGSCYVYKRQKSISGIDTDAVKAFVTRLYSNVLERTPDADGLSAWVNRLTSREWGGGQVAETFFFDPKYEEFLNRGLNNDEFLLIMYRTFMDRDPDPTGWEAWLDRMANQGYTWKDVFDGFVVSTEWGERCDAAGIRR